MLTNEFQIKRLADMVETLTQRLSASNPGGFVSVRHTTNIKDSVLVCLSALPREQWPNDIFENCGTKIIIMEKSNRQREGDSGEYEVEQLSNGDHNRIPKMRRRTASAAKIVEYVCKWAESITPTA